MTRSFRDLKERSSPLEEANLGSPSAAESPNASGDIDTASKAAGSAAGMPGTAWKDQEMGPKLVSVDRFEMVQVLNGQIFERRGRCLVVHRCLLLSSFISAKHVQSMFKVCPV